MKNRVLSITTVYLLTILVCGSLKSQVYTPSKAKQYGSLTDKVHLLTLYVDTKYGEWDDETEIDYYYDKLMASQDWLIDEAAIWGQDLEFENDYFNMDNKSVVYLNDDPKGKRPSHTLQQIMEELSYDDFDDFIEENGFDLENDKLKIVLFVKNSNRSHAYNYWSTKDMDFAIVYCRSTMGTITNQNVISHEILHMFGAWDLYYERGKSQTEESGKKALENYPNSIMINTWKDVSELEVDELTAWRVGWTRMKEEFREFDPQLNKEEISEEFKDSRSRKTKTKIEFDFKNKKSKKQN